MRVARDVPQQSLQATHCIKVLAALSAFSDMMLVGCPASKQLVVMISFLVSAARRFCATLCVVRVRQRVFLLPLQTCVCLMTCLTHTTVVWMKSWHLAGLSTFQTIRL